jgi:Holliday junction resolvasome RuvABC DNA-binding subunit
MIPTITVLKNLLKIPGLGPKTAISLLSAVGISPITKYQQLEPFKQDLLLQALASLRKSSN